MNVYRIANEIPDFLPSKYLKVTKSIATATEPNNSSVSGSGIIRLKLYEIGGNFCISSHHDRSDLQSASSQQATLGGSGGIRTHEPHFWGAG